MIGKNHSPRTEEELYTRNLISVYQDDGLTAHMDEADRHELENLILQRVGVKDA